MSWDDTDAYSHRRTTRQSVRGRTGVLADLVEELGNELLLLHELDVGEHLGRQLDGLAEPVLTTCIS